MTRVMLMSAGFGDGHRQVARALREACEAREAQVHELDALEETSASMADFQEGMYHTITRYAPWLYGWSYDWTKRWGPASPLWPMLAVFSGRAYRRAVDAWRPDVVLQLFPDHAPALTRRSGPRGGTAPEPWLGVVLTDFSVHGHWFHRRADAYFVADEGLVAEARRFSGRAKVMALGIPVRRQFQLRHPRPDGAGPGPYVLLMTGGRGLFPDLAEVLETVLQFLPDHRVVVLCGRNDRMRRWVEGRGDPRLRAVGFVEQVAPWLQHATLAFVKAGGVSVSECLASACPMVFYKPLPGQEADNARFLQSMGAGWTVADVPALRAALNRIDLVDEVRRMKERCRCLARPDAADAVAEAALAAARARTAGHDGRDIV
ncbi:glycosyltransferase [Alicyclobacillus sp.]|uniref:MGDG synthase family glycosyltransferase n=1 Tax=Alicyclobacillus sp. TaxID=61169 RepID=UPI0025B8724A|nr:glycosyltransferase [Alicyclobacillus sp.]MCL6517289.1 galactosyldiacylglycerol synthase [Alicyclobacillus sp.]